MARARRTSASADKWRPGGGLYSAVARGARIARVDAYMSGLFRRNRPPRAAADEETGAEPASLSEPAAADAPAAHEASGDAPVVEHIRDIPAGVDPDEILDDRPTSHRRSQAPPARPVAAQDPRAAAARPRRPRARDPPAVGHAEHDDRGPLTARGARADQARAPGPRRGRAPRPARAARAAARAGGAARARHRRDLPRLRRAVRQRRPLLLELRDAAHPRRAPPARGHGGAPSSRRRRASRSGCSAAARRRTTRGRTRRRTRGRRTTARARRTPTTTRATRGARARSPLRRAHPDGVPADPDQQPAAAQEPVRSGERRA